MLAYYTVTSICCVSMVNGIPFSARTSKQRAMASLILSSA